MIEWVTNKQFEERLRQYPPIGLALRSFFQARTSEEPQNWFSREPETLDEQGLGEVLVWSGFVDTLPFVVSAMSRRSGWGFEIRLPYRIDGDRRLFEAIANLGLPKWTHPYVENLPARDGFGVLEIGTTTPVYVSKHRDDAVAASSLLNTVEPAKYAVVPTTESESAWLVVGPESGPYWSRVAVMHDERAARDQASRWSQETGAEFRVNRVP